MTGTKSNSFIFASVAAVVTAAAAAFMVSRRRRKRRRQRQADAERRGMLSDPSTKLVQLLELEEMILKLGVVPPVGTVTWFEGDADMAYQQIEQRMQGIIKQNPWLKGQFVKANGHSHIAYNETSSCNVHEEGMLNKVQAQDSKVFYSMPFIEFNRTSIVYVLQPKKDYDQPFWKVSIVPCSKSPTQRFALFFSMSHILGDGHNYYTLLNMISGAAPIRPLEIERLHKTKKLQEETMGIKEANIMSSFGYIACALRGVISEALGLSRVSYRIFILDDKKIDAIKKDYNNTMNGNSSTMNSNGKSNGGCKDHSFISTNDIVTSWFLSNCQGKYGWMLVNMRNKLPGHTEDMVGNYENVITYRIPEDVSTPSKIRSSVKSLRRPDSIQKRDELSDLAMASGSLGVISNWASFCLPAKVTNCQELLHLPCGSALPPTMPFCILFRARGGKLGVAVAGPGDFSNIRAPFESFEDNLY